MSGSQMKPNQLHPDHTSALHSTRPMWSLLNGPSDYSIAISSDCNHTHMLSDPSFFAIIHLSQKKWISTRMMVLEGCHMLITALSLDFSIAWEEISARFEFLRIWPKENFLKAIIRLPNFSLRTGNRLLMS